MITARKHTRKTDRLIQKIVRHTCSMSPTVIQSVRAWNSLDEVEQWTARKLLKVNGPEGLVDMLQDMRTIQRNCALANHNRQAAFLRF